MHRSLWRNVIGVVLLWSAVGCESRPDRPVPTTFPVTGQILDQDGKPLTSGSIQFRTVAEPPTTSSGTIAADGTFTLSTFVDVDRIQGTVPGKYKVTIYPTVEGQHSVPSIPVKDVYTVEPQENHFTIRIDRPRG